MNKGSFPDDPEVLRVLSDSELEAIATSASEGSAFAHRPAPGSAVALDSVARSEGESSH